MHFEAEFSSRIKVYQTFCAKLREDSLYPSLADNLPRGYREIGTRAARVIRDTREECGPSTSSDVSIALRNCDRALREAARVLLASSWGPQTALFLTTRRDVRREFARSTRPFPEINSNQNSAI